MLVVTAGDWLSENSTQPRARVSMLTALDPSSK